MLWVKQKMKPCLMFTQTSDTIEQTVLETEQTNCYKSNKHNLTTYQNRCVIHFS